MRARVTPKPEQEVIAAIQALNLETVKMRLMDTEVGKSWTQEYANSIEEAYKNYLTMLVKYPDDAEDILLSKDVDEFWHTHILQTSKYADDCQNVFGAFIHHSPHVGPRGEAVLAKRSELAAKTSALYQKEFGNAERAAVAWYGALGDASTGEMRAERAALSNYEIRAGQAALSNYEIKMHNAALSNYEISPANAALSNYEIRADKAALSNYEIREEHAALSNYDASMSSRRPAGREIRSVSMADAARTA